MEQGLLSFAAPSRRVLTVAELNLAIAGLLGREFDDIWVSGEISGVRMQPSGHCYFTLKEQDAQIRCALFRGSMRFLKFKPMDGMAVVARGRVDVFQQRGEYQLIVEMLEPQGVGALQLAFEQLKKKLAAEGLFDAERKRALPKFPARIGIVTSPRGAVISDMLHVLERRFPGLQIRLFPALVQGEGSVDEVVRGINYFSRGGWADVLIVARGGGSLEDLWTFNEERVARAIAACAVPVISAIGHETDFTILDFVADKRAPTPSAAAELVICTRLELQERIQRAVGRAGQAMRYKLALLHRRVEQQAAARAATMLHRAINRRVQMVDDCERRLMEAMRRKLAKGASSRRDLEGKLRYFDIRPRLQRDRNRLDTATAKSKTAMQLALAARRRKLETLIAGLHQLSPLKILERGYAIVTTKTGAILKDASDAPAGTAMKIRLSRGVLNAESGLTEKQTDEAESL